MSPSFAPSAGMAGALLVAGLVVVAGLVAWYVIGTQVQRAAATRLARRAADLVRPLGAEGSFRWLGRTGGELRLADARPPFRSVQAVIWLRPRELLPAWIMSQVQRRSDLFAVAADLDVAPKVDFELVDPLSAVGHRALLKARLRGWSSERVQLTGKPLLLLSPTAGATRKIATRVLQCVPPDRADVLRLAVSRESPHLGVTVAHPDRLGGSRDRFATWLTRVAVQAKGTDAPARAEKGSMHRGPT